jgi:hypothetical protein
MTSDHLPINWVPPKLELPTANFDLVDAIAEQTSTEKFVAGLKKRRAFLVKEIAKTSALERELNRIDMLLAADDS